MRDRAQSAHLPRRYRRRRCILRVDGFFEWKAIKGQKAKQPYAIAMKDGSPFGIGENDDPSIVEPIEAHVATCTAVETVGPSIWNHRLARRW